MPPTNQRAMTNQGLLISVKAKLWGNELGVCLHFVPQRRVVSVGASCWETRQWLVPHTSGRTSSSWLSFLLEHDTWPREDPAPSLSIARSPGGHSQKAQNSVISMALAAKSKSNASLPNLTPGKSELCFKQVLLLRIHVSS